MPEQIVYTFLGPIPGSASAGEQGCTCPAGLPGIGNLIFPGGQRAWRVTVGCPVHDAPPPEQQDAPRESHSAIMRRVRAGLCEIVRLTSSNLYDVMAANEVARKLLQEVGDDEE